MTGSLIEVATDPESFYESTGPGRSLKGPAAVVFAVALIQVFAVGIQSYPQIQAAGEQVRQFLLIGTAIGLVVPFVIAGVAWLVYAGLFHGISTFYDGEGEFSETLAVVGWGFVPKIIGSLVAFVVTVVIVQQVPAPTTQQELMRYSATVQSHWLTQLQTAAAIVLPLWSGFIWTYGIADVHGIDTREAAITVGIPVALSILATTAIYFVSQMVMSGF